MYFEGMLFYETEAPLSSGENIEATVEEAVRGTFPDVLVDVTLESQESRKGKYLVCLAPVRPDETMSLRCIMETIERYQLRIVDIIDLNEEEFEHDPWGRAIDEKAIMESARDGQVMFVDPEDDDEEPELFS